MSGGRFVIRNGSRYPDDEVRALIRFATQDVDMRAVCVNVKRMTRHGWKGWAYEGVPIQSNAPRGSRYLITLRVGEDTRYPVERSHVRRGEPRIVLHDWRETLVFLAAHEAKHIEQYRENLPRSEVRCNVFAAHMVNRYRAQVSS